MTKKSINDVVCDSNTGEITMPYNPPTMNDIASKHLGQGGSYAITTDKFDPSLLVQMPRELARKDWGIIGNEFVGVDTWHCHEATFLTDNGLPIAGTLKIAYDSSSQFMVESKSIKLYLNSFDMCKMGPTIEKALENYELQIAKDLSNIVQSTVKVNFFANNADKFGEDPGIEYEDIYNVLSPEELDSIVIDDYKADQEHLKITPSEENHTYRLTTNVLRSRCRHTKQKDTGTAFIYLTTKKAELDVASLLKEIISLREVNEFHEFCAEKLFVALKQFAAVDECCVMLLYSRRGSWDINPVRATSYDIIPNVLKDVTIYTSKQTGQ